MEPTGIRVKKLKSEVRGKRLWKHQKQRHTYTYIPTYTNNDNMFISRVTSQHFHKRFLLTLAIIKDGVRFEPRASVEDAPSTPPPDLGFGKGSGKWQKFLKQYCEFV